MWASPSCRSFATVWLRCSAGGTATTGSPRNPLRAPATGASASTARWTRWSGRRARRAASPPTSSTRSFPASSPCGSIRWKWATASGRMAASACSLSRRREWQSPGGPPCSPTTSTTSTTAPVRSTTGMSETAAAASWARWAAVKTPCVPWTICSIRESRWALNSWRPTCRVSYPSTHHLLHFSPFTKKTTLD